MTKRYSGKDTMPLKTKADIYLAHLDTFLSGKAITEPIEDEEINNLLQLSKSLITSGLRISSNRKENIKKQLLAKAAKLDRSHLAKESCELDDSALEDVSAAGLTGRAGEYEDLCPYCGTRSKKLAGKCLLCKR